MPGTAAGSATRYTARRLRVPASVRSNPAPSVNLTRSASGPRPGLGGSGGCFSRHRSQPARARWVIRCSARRAAGIALGDQVEEFPEPAGRRDRPAGQRGQRRVVGLQHRELRDVGALDDAAHGSLPQVCGERLYLWKFRHASNSALCRPVPALTGRPRPSGRVSRPGRGAPASRPRAGQAADQVRLDGRPGREHEQEQRFPGQPLGMLPGQDRAAALYRDQRGRGPDGEFRGGGPGGWQLLAGRHVQVRAARGELAVERAAADQRAAPPGHAE